MTGHIQEVLGVTALVLVSAAVAVLLLESVRIVQWVVRKVRR